MSQKIVIVHGWSDHSGSFENLARHIEAKLNIQTEVISLCDWLSLDDDVTFKDLVAAFDKEWDFKELPRSGRSVDVILHSTGSLLLRDWLLTKFGSKPKEDLPIKRLVQLAPANFGSPLAHMGRSVLGRARVGFQVARGKKKKEVEHLMEAFEPGQELLKGLELGSAYTWSLAESDCFGKQAEWYGKGGILSTILIGNEGTQMFVKDFNGSDGTVRTSNANLNAKRIRVKLPDKNQEIDISEAIEETKGQHAFRIVNGFSHGGITLNEEQLSSKLLGEYHDDQSIRMSDMDLLDLIVKSLEVDDHDFDAWCADCDSETLKITTDLNKEGDDEVHAYSTVVVRLKNQWGEEVDDYIFEMYVDSEFDGEKAVLTKQEKSITREFQKRVVDDVHRNKVNPAYVNFHFDTSALGKLMRRNNSKKFDLCFSITAAPILVRSGSKKGGQFNRNVGYLGLDDNDIAHAVIPFKKLKEVFAYHQTTFIDVEIIRQQSHGVVRLS